MGRAGKKFDFSIAEKAIRTAGLFVVRECDIDYLSDVATDAYEDYPLHNWLSGGKFDRKATKLVMQITLKSLFGRAVIYADSKQMNGFAVWIPPGFTGISSFSFFRYGGFKLIAQSGPEIIRRLLSYEKFAMNLKRETTGHNDWYLYNLSVMRESQRKGIGTRLLVPMMKYCEEEKSDIFLETNMERNVGMYIHYGFDLVKECQIPDSSVPHYVMVKRASQNK